LSCATLDAGSSRGIIAALQDAVQTRRTLGLAGAEVRVAEIDTLTSSHDMLLRRASKSRRIELAFLSPTLFRRSGESLVLPQPELAFGSLLRAWNAFSPLQFPPYGTEDLGAPMICHHNIRTEMVQFGSYKLLGFVGRVGYLIPAEVPELLCRTLNCLADYAFFAGVGYRTTMGMGQCRRA
ncbi:MAG: CRISPR system precrRNA processing endoribonuclease RAMP protein Cas6, partial [Armatimonadota bacterium]